MVRTVISLDPNTKAWIDEKARQTGKTMTAVVREAIQSYRAQEAEREQPALADLLEQTAGLWTRGDGLAWQRKIRGEWDTR